MSEIPTVHALAGWIEENRAALTPPVNNREMYPGSKNLVTMVVGGPNQRTDFHFEPYEELFYQIQGDMHVNIQTEEGVRRIDVREGDMWLLPGNTWHSPQRPEAGSIGLVIEQVREKGVTEKFGWFCLECNNQVWEVEVQLEDIAKDLPPLFQAFYASSEAERTCSRCGAVHPGKG